MSEIPFPDLMRPEILWMVFRFRDSVGDKPLSSLSGIFAIRLLEDEVGSDDEEEELYTVT
jgi:hypothetical protein